jgi:hypothetical protein
MRFLCGSTRVIHAGRPKAGAKLAMTEAATPLQIIKRYSPGMIGGAKLEAITPESSGCRIAYFATRLCQSPSVP